MRKVRESSLVGLDVHAVYSVATLARLGNVTRHRLRRLLESNGVILIRGGRAVFVSLSEIQRKIPPLWESLCLVARLRSTGRPLGRPGSPWSQEPQG
jgi:hypothetical protein